MGCATSLPASEGQHTVPPTGVIDLALLPMLTDATVEDLPLRRTIDALTLLLSPTWPRPKAALTGAGFKAICNAAHRSLRIVELNQESLPRVSGDDAAHALALLPLLHQVTIRGRSLPESVLVRLAATKPKPRVLKVTLGGAGITAATIAALATAFPLLEIMSLEDLSDSVDWVDIIETLRCNGVRFERLTTVTMRNQPSALIAAFAALCPALPSFAGATADAAMSPDMPVQLPGLTTKDTALSHHRTHSGASGSTPTDPKTIFGSVRTAALPDTSVLSNPLLRPRSGGVRIHARLSCSALRAKEPPVVPVRPPAAAPQHVLTWVSDQQKRRVM